MDKQIQLSKKAQMQTLQSLGFGIVVLESLWELVHMSFIRFKLKWTTSQQ